MAVSKVLFVVVLLGICGAVYCDSPYTTESTTLGSGTGSTTPGAYGASPSSAADVQDVLSETNKATICDVKSGGSNNSNSTDLEMCVTTGPADDFCSKLAASVNGNCPSCVAVNVCSFKVASNSSNSSNSTASTGSTTAGIGSTTAGTGSTTAGTDSTTAGTGSTTAGTGTGSTTAGTGSTSLASGSPAGSAIVPEPNTAYIACHTVPAGFQQIKTCPSSKAIFVYPSASGSSGSTTVGTGSTTVGTGSTTTRTY
ncbi:hypothetical protein WDU94_011683 [Cyamophila willieti]